MRKPDLVCDVCYRGPRSVVLGQFFVRRLDRLVHQKGYATMAHFTEMDGADAGTRRAITEKSFAEWAVEPMPPEYHKRRENDYPAVDEPSVG